MENQDDQNFSTNTGNSGNLGAQELPGAKNAYTLGLVGMILSFICCCFIHVIGSILGVIALIKSKEAITAYEANPGAFDEAMYKKAKLARTFGIVAIAVGVFFLILYILSNFVGFLGNMYDYKQLQHRFR